MTDDQLTVYADYVCPFCYLGHASLDEYLSDRDAPLEIAWHPFDLRGRQRGPDGAIDHAADDGKDDAYYEQARENVRRLQAEYDVEMTQEIAKDVDSLPAQIASWHVQTASPDLWPAFDEAIYDALWTEGRDVGDPDVLADVAADVGLDPDEIRSVIDDDAAREALEEQFQAAQRAGVSGVPTFVYADHAARGAVPPEHLRRLIEGT